MSQNGGEDTAIYKLIVNERGQYSIWPYTQKTPDGWRDVGKTGSREDCLIYINLLHVSPDAWSEVRDIEFPKKEIL